MGPDSWLGPLQHKKLERILEQVARKIGHMDRYGYHNLSRREHRQKHHRGQEDRRQHADSRDRNRETAYHTISPLSKRKLNNKPFAPTFSATPLVASYQEFLSGSPKGTQPHTRETPSIAESLEKEKGQCSLATLSRGFPTSASLCSTEPMSNLRAKLDSIME